EITRKTKNLGVEITYDFFNGDKTQPHFSNRPEFVGTVKQVSEYMDKEIRNNQAAFSATQFFVGGKRIMDTDSASWEYLRKGQIFTSIWEELHSPIGEAKDSITVTVEEVSND
ncbi:MAG: hypothetical protein JNJ94_06390, partial [Chlorobi bacterium]|nr:hypothetical protein [Chlorobiota bacterium]